MPRALQPSNSASRIACACSKGTAAEPGVGATAPAHLAPPGRGDAGRHQGRSLRRRRFHVLGRIYPRHVHPQIDSVPKRARYSAGIPGNDAGLAMASPVALAGVSARARVHGGTTPPSAV
jgi:hypothetical protein